MSAEKREKDPQEELKNGLEKWAIDSAGDDDNVRGEIKKNLKEGKFFDPIVIEGNSTSIYDEVKGMHDYYQEIIKDSDASEADKKQADIFAERLAYVESFLVKPVEISRANKDRKIGKGEDSDDDFLLTPLEESESLDLKPLDLKEIPAPVEPLPESRSEKTPWLEEEKRKQGELYEKYMGVTELPTELKRKVTQELESDLDNRREDFLLQWFNDHRKELGFSKGLTDAQKKRTAIEHGAFTKLIDEEDGEGKKRYAKEYKSIEVVSALKMDFSSENTSLASQALTLKYFELKRVQFDKDIADLWGKKDEASIIELENKRKQKKELVILEAQLIKSVTGNDVILESENAITHDNSYSEKKFEKDYGKSVYDEELSKVSGDIIKKNFNGDDFEVTYKQDKLMRAMSGNVTEEQFWGLMRNGYDPATIQTENWAVTKEILKDVGRNWWNIGIVPLFKYMQNGSSLLSIERGGTEEVMSGEELTAEALTAGEELRKELIVKTKQRLEKYRKQDIEQSKQRIIEEAVNESVANIKGTVAEYYDQIKEKLLKDAVEGKLKKPDKKAKTKTKSHDKK